MPIRGGVRCDRSGCKWEVDNVVLNEYMNKNCPNCNTPLFNTMDKLLVYIGEILEKLHIISQEPDAKGFPIHIDTDRRPTSERK